MTVGTDGEGSPHPGGAHPAGAGAPQACSEPVSTPGITANCPSILYPPGSCSRFLGFTAVSVSQMRWATRPRESLPAS